MIWGICATICLAATGPILGAEATFNGVYSGRRVLTKGSDPTCPSEENVSVTIKGDELMFTNSALQDFGIGFDPNPDGSFRETYVDIGGAYVDIRGRIVDDLLDADVTNGSCEHHWHLKKESPRSR
jgi:hypothetical protein